jgi:AcrR family transcriptional regulator
VSSDNPGQSLPITHVTPLIDVLPRRSRGSGRPARRTNLSRTQIVDAAVSLADLEGLEAVSMRRIAAHLGVGTMSLYGYVPDREALLASMLNRVLSFPDLPERPSRDWRADVGLVARALRGLCRHHAWVPTLLGASPWLFVPGLLAPAELVLTSLAAHGIDVRTGAGIFRLLSDYVVGSALRDATEAHDGEPRDPSDGYEAAVAVYLRQVAADGRFPRLSQLGRLIIDGRDLSVDQRFELGLRCLLDGVGARVAEAAARQPPG